MATLIEKAVKWAEDIANDNTHGYSQADRWSKDFDCSSLVISAYDAAGLAVKKNGANNTSDMIAAFKASGFKDVSSKVNFANGDGLMAGDVLWRKGHVGMSVGNKKYVSASSNKDGKAGDSSGSEIAVKNYYNDSWTVALRYG